MDIILILIPAALALGFMGLCAFIWSLKSGQFDDPIGNAARILQDEPPAAEQPILRDAQENAERPVRDGHATPASHNSR